MKILATFVIILSTVFTLRGQDSNNLDSLLKAGLDAYWDWDKMLKIYSEVLSSDQDNCIALNNIYTPYYELGLYDSSLAVSLRYLYKCSEDNYGHFGIASSYYKMGLKRKAYDEFLIVVNTQEDGKAIVLNYFVNEYYDSVGFRIKEEPELFPISDYEFLYTLTPNSQELNRLMAKAYWHNQNYIKAILHSVKSKFVSEEIE